MAIDWRNVGSAAVLFFALGAIAWWRISEDGKTRSSGHVIEDKLEVSELADEAVVAQLFEVARAELFGGEAEAPAGLDGRRVFVCAYHDGPLPPCGMGEGEDLSSAVRVAARDLGKVWADATPDARLKIDFTVLEKPVTFPDKDVSRHDVGMYGYLLERPEGNSWLLPSEVLEAGVYTGGEGQKPGVKDKILARKLERRNPRIGELDPTGFDYIRFRSASWVENAAGNGILRTYRLHRWDYEEPTPDLLLERSVLAADYLQSSVSEDGRIRYLYDPTHDRTLPGYNLLRHGGTTYSILQAYQRTGFEPYLKAAEGAIGFLLRNTKTDTREGPYGGGDVRYVVESKYIKLGGAGLGLVMLAEYQLATGKETYVQEAGELARFLVSQQKEDGEFIYFAPLIPGEKPKDQASAYYPGEAILGLAKQYALDGNPLWLETAERGAQWLINVRDGGKPPQRLANDHWLMIAMSYLYANTENELYLSHSLSLAQAVKFQADKRPSHVRNHRDYAGGYYEPPRSTPAATRGEGLVAVLDTCKHAERDCAWVRDLLLRTVKHELQCQYTPDHAWWLANPSRALGAFNGGIIDTQIRNDYTQHNLSSVLGTERHLRSETRLPGGPSWKPAEAAAFEGVPSSTMEDLREMIRAVRPPTRWEEQQIAAEPAELPE